MLKKPQHINETVITEAKLDNMTANDQAYDSHASNGYLSNNNVGFWCKDSGGTNRLVSVIDGSDVLQIGENNVNDHTIVNAGTSKLVKIKVLRQVDTTDTYTEDTVFLTGFGVILQTATRTKAETVNYGITFSEVPVPLITSNGGDIVSGTPPNSSGRGLATVATADTLAVGSFRAVIDTLDGGNFTNGEYTHYSWLAAGKLS